MQIRTTGGKLKKCDLTLHWPEKMTFIATATKRVEAEKIAAALACLKLKVSIILRNYHVCVATVYICTKNRVQEMELLDKNNNPLTHARYHREEVKEAVEREKQPLSIDIPTHLQEKMRQYLAEVNLHLRHYFTAFLFGLTYI